MRMRVLWTAAMIALLAGPGYAQEKPIPRYGDMGKAKTWGEMEQDKETERAYKRSLGNVPDKGPVDPWGNARSVGEPKANAKATTNTDTKPAAAKPKAKAAETAK